MTDPFEVQVREALGDLAYNSEGPHGRVVCDFCAATLADKLAPRVAAAIRTGMDALTRREWQGSYPLDSALTALRGTA